MHKHLSLLSLTIMILALLLTGCSQAASATTAEEASIPAVGAFKVAMLLPGQPEEDAYSRAGYEGLKLIEQELGAQVVHTASVPVDDAEKVFHQYAEEGYDFIIAQGGEFIAAAEKVAEEFPRIKFAVVAGYAGNNKNLGALSLRGSEIGYLTGTVAGLKTESNKVAFIGGVPYAHIKEQAALFERGAKAANPSVEVEIAYVESWTDVDKAREIARAQIEAGADVLVANVDEASDAIIEVAKSAGIYAIGWSKDKHDFAPDTVLTSGIQEIKVAVLEGAILVQQGRWEGKQYKFGLREGAQDLAPFYGLLTAEEEAKVNAVKEEILTGKVNLTP